MIPARDGLPPRGEPNGENERTCVRVTNGIIGPDEVLCGKRAVLHVIWEDDGTSIEQGYACDAHAAEVRERWKPFATHPLGSFCGMPGALYFPAENVCRIDGELPTVEPVRAVAIPVPVR